MVVIYDRFVFFSVEKFFIPLLYSCLNILVQRSCANACLQDISAYLHACLYACFMRVSEGVRAREREKGTWGARDSNDLEISAEEKK